ncbi:MAG TPA: hypothetical protein VLI41_00820 [Phenylobacterium sp.]|uniref:hypothetical protein n=1 Tax=Phenylobacterium sp. TaxID=1871053 RepID=UPI002D04A083|nr:hypothetical protein [Phenylobacterium sp.]HSV01721.1 hypothetical protein [Phenylobacterium sp.]
MPVITSDIDPDHNALVENDSGAGGDFPWEQAATETHVLDHVLKPPTHGGGGGGGGGGGTTFPTQASDTQPGPTFDTNATINKNYFIPPDSTSAAGKEAILVGVNGVIEEFDRTAGVDTLTPHALGFALDDVFKSATGFLGSAFDPHIMYDPTSDRFIVVAVDQNATNKTSQLLVAVSNNGTPHGAADFHAVAIDANAGGGSWADFPQVGLDSSGHIYITANMFAFSGGSYTGTHLWVEDESNLSASVAGATVPSTGTDDFFSAAPTYDPHGTGEFLVSYNSATDPVTGDNVLHVVQVNPNGSLGTEQTVDLKAKIDQLTTFGGISVPQPGTSHTLDGDDSRTSLAVMQGGHLYVAATILPTTGLDAGHATAHWFELGVDASGNVTLLNQGDVSGNTAFSGSGLRTFYPSVAVSTDATGNDELAISFSTSAPQTGTIYDGFPSAYEETIDPATGASTLGWQLLEGGLANYTRTFGTHDNRWGDYSSISTDPLHPGQYWAFNQFAETQGTSLMGETGRWATELGLFS